MQITPMQARMANPASVVPGAVDALTSLGRVVTESGIPPTMLGLVHLRASQINGCSVCTMLHLTAARKLGETDERLFAVAAWRDAPFFSDAERAALALTEAVTCMSNQPDPVPDDVWHEATKHFDERDLGALVLAIAVTNVWNRLNVTTRQVAGQGW